MTAIPGRRKRRTLAAMVAAMVMVMAAVVLFAVGVVTLSNSKEGEAVGVDDRPVVALPETPNALLAVADRNGALASLVVMTLLPEGLGGSIVTVPVSADATSGFGANRQPLSSLFDARTPGAFVDAVEAMLSITIERSEVVDQAGLDALLTPIDAISVNLPEDVIDTSKRGTGIIATAGPQTLRRSLVAESLASVDTDGRSYDHHDVDVELWSQLARAAPLTVPPEAVTTDDLGRPVPPASVDDLMRQLWDGDVEVRDLAVTKPTDAENPTSADVVILDRSDSVLVFSQISPALMSTPNPGLTLRIESPFSEQQLVAGGGFDSSSELVKGLIGQLLFFQANVVSVDTASAPQGAAAITRIEVADQQFLEDMTTAAPLFFGPSEVELATTVLEGVDAVVTLGTGYFDRDSTAVTAPGTTVGDDPGGTAPVGTGADSGVVTIGEGTVGSDG